MIMDRLNWFRDFHTGLYFDAIAALSKVSLYDNVLVANVEKFISIDITYKFKMKVAFVI